MDSQPQLFETVRLTRERLHVQIADSIQEMIARQQIQVGDRLPPERELAKLLGVNRTTVREALRLLQQRGLVEMKTGSGTYVRQVSPMVVGEAIERLYISNDCSYEDLVALRTIVEPGIAMLAAAQATPEDLTRLRAALERLTAAWNVDENSDETNAADVDFHTALAHASHNELLIAIFNGIRMVMQRWMKTYASRNISAYDAQELHRRLKHHHDLYDAVAAKDVHQARALMCEQLRVLYIGNEDAPLLALLNP